MPSEYPILYNRPIDQWKVVELKEELKKRKLAIKGLKDDLIKRLAEAIRSEGENAEDEVDDHSSHPAGDKEDAEEVGVSETEKHDPLVDGSNTKSSDAGKVDANGNPDAASEENTQDEVVTGNAGPSKGGTSIDGHIEPLESESEVIESVAVIENVAHDLADSGKDEGNSVTQEIKDNSNDQLDNGDPKPLHEHDIPVPQLDNEDPKPQLEQEDKKSQLQNEDSKPQLETENSNSELENEDSKPQPESENPKSELESEDLKPSQEVVKHDPSSPNDQVSEVSPSLGFQAKSDSLSTDSVSFNEKNELKDNIIADNVKLELDVVKPEMVGLSWSSNVVPVAGESHPMDVEEPQKKKALVEEKDGGDVYIGDVEKKIDSIDVGDSEKLNLDRSSGDDSMDEDILESRQIDSKYNSDEVGNRNETDDVPVNMEVNTTKLDGNKPSVDQTETLVENKSGQDVGVEKRKLNDQEAVSTEPLKRQRRWNSDSSKSLDVQNPSQSSTLIHVSTPKDTDFQPPKRNFSRSDSMASEEAPKERVVPSSQKPPTNSLKIDRFLRPFTLKAVQELLGKTGTIRNFWMDNIKTHCFVTYSSVEEAVETRNAVYNLQWPPNGGRLLVAEFVDPQEVKSKVDAPPSPAAAKPAAAPVPSPSSQPQPSPRQQATRQQLPPPPTLPPPPPLSNPPLVKERLVPPPPPPLSEKPEAPIVTLDDLFRKTKAVPRIYYLPLSDEQVAEKKRRGQQGRNGRP